MTSLELLVCAALISFSALMSASEVALFSLSRFQLRFLKEHFRPAYRRIKNLLSDPGGLLITILVVNEVVNIALSSLITKVVARSHRQILEHFNYVPHSQIPNWALETFVGILITTPLILFLCEITPKVVAARMNQLVAPLTVRILSRIYNEFKPIRFVMKHIIEFVSRLILPESKAPAPSTPEAVASSTGEGTSILKESDFLLMVEEGHKEGAIQQSELDLIRKVFELDNRTVQDVSTPLSQVLSIPVSTTIKEALVLMRTQRYSRIPVTGANRKEVVGIVYAKDLLRTKLHPENASIPVGTLMRKPLFVKSTLRLNALFRKFKRYKNHMAIVKTPNEEVTGVVTMSDLLDALFEDLFSDEELNEDFRILRKQNQMARQAGTGGDYL